MITKIPTTNDDDKHMRKSYCRVCGMKVDAVRNIDLYVIGSEGLDTCHTCEMQIVGYVRSMMAISTRVKLAIYKGKKNSDGI